MTLFVLTSEMKRWLEHAIRLKSANQLLGDDKFNVVFMQSMQYFTFFQAFVVLGGLALTFMGFLNVPDSNSSLIN